MSPRLLALSIGTCLAATLLGVVLWARYGHDPLHDIPLHVVDARGKPVERFGWTVTDDTPGSGEYIMTGEQEAPRPGGTAVVRMRRHVVSLEVSAPGLARSNLGPFEPDAIPTRFDVVLKDLGLVRGVVTHAGKPVAGATVELLMERGGVADEDHSGLYYGYDDLRGTTDASGVFAIGSDWPNMPYTARACKEGYAIGIVGPVHVGDAAVEIRLPSGGTIEGVLHTRGDGSVAGAAIQLYRDPPSEPLVCGRYVAHADANGHFRFEHVEAGAWLVGLVPQDAPRGGHEPTPVDLVPYVVSVRDMEATTLDMDLRRPVAHLDGHLMLDGKPWKNAFVHLCMIGEREFVLDRIGADADGRWTMRTREPGKYRLVVQGDHKHHGEPREYSEVVELSIAGVKWEHDQEWRD